MTPADHLAPVFAQYPIEVTDAQGVWLHTKDNRRVLDLYGGHAVAALGYKHEAWTQAVTAQANACNFQSNAVPMAVRVRAATKLIRFSGSHFDSVFFVNSGAEANENALRMAFKMTRRTGIVAIEGAFHGRTAAAGAITWGAEKKWYEFPRAPFDVSYIPRRDLKAIVHQVCAETAAVIVEPVQGVGGAFDMGTEFLSALRARCTAVGALLIFDEVQIGMGRSGHPFAANLYGVLPDMITTAKALGNGFPCGALLMSPEVTASLKLEGLGTTFGGGPMACAAIEAVIDAIENEDLMTNVRRVAQYIRDTCTVGPVIGHQGAGFLHGLKTSQPAKEIQALLLERNILTGTSGDPNVVRLLPPYILKEKHVDLLREALQSI
ncbi:MAG: aspartate aminotransferase family protein [Gammaproteobacteria bacterium]|nr:aspartate aminotransferase family protein [Gammaproteobacteria bacterium]